MFFIPNVGPMLSFFDSNIFLDFYLVVCFLGVSNPSVIVILGRKGGLRPATLSQQNMKIGLGRILALNVPRR